MGDRTVLLGTGAALVGVVVGFFAMLHFAGTAAKPRSDRTLPNPILTQSEIRYRGWSYKAVVRHWGTGTGTDYYRYDGGWRAIAWDDMPREAYRKLRVGLRVPAPRR